MKCWLKLWYLSANNGSIVFCISLHIDSEDGMLAIQNWDSYSVSIWSISIDNHWKTPSCSVPAVGIQRALQESIKSMNSTTRNKPIYKCWMPLQPQPRWDLSANLSPFLCLGVQAASQVAELQPAWSGQSALHCVTRDGKLVLSRTLNTTTGMEP